MMPPSSWDFFDKIYCITIDNRIDRRIEAKKQFAAVGLGKRVEFVIVKKHLHDPVKGIFQSHIHCLTKGLEAGARHIMVFEDDVFFRGCKDQTLRDASVFLRDNTHWDAFFLGCITRGSARTDNSAVVKVQYHCLAHAYALNRPFAERLVRESWSGTPYDDLLRQLNANFFALSPMCAFQGLAGTDNQTVAVNRIRNLFGGLPLVQKGNEIFQNHKPLVIALHLILLAAIGILLLSS